MLSEDTGRKHCPQARKRILTRNQLCQALIWDFPASRTVRKYISVVEASSLRHLGMAAGADWYRSDCAQTLAAVSLDGVPGSAVAAFLGDTQGPAEVTPASL